MEYGEWSMEYGVWSMEYGEVLEDHSSSLIRYRCDTVAIPCNLLGSATTSQWEHSKQVLGFDSGMKVEKSSRSRGVVLVFWRAGVLVFWCAGVLELMKFVLICAIRGKEKKLDSRSSRERQKGGGVQGKSGTTEKGLDSRLHGNDKRVLECWGSREVEKSRGRRVMKLQSDSLTMCWIPD